MRILITGGTGFLGRHLLPMLAGHELFVISRGAHVEGGFPDGINWIEADLGAGLDTSLLPARMDGVIHLAQSDRYRDFPGGAADMFRVNVETPARLLQWAEKAGVSSFVAASTGTVYEPFDGPMREDDFVSPRSYYGASKLAAEALALAYGGVFNVTQLRVFFLYGPGQRGMMIANIIDSIRKGKTLTLPKDNDGLEFVPTFVEDTARVFVQALEEGWNGVYNVAAPHRINFRQLLEQIGEALGRRPVIERIEAERPTPIVPSLEKIAARVDIDSFLTFRQGLEKTLAAEAASR